MIQEVTIATSRETNTKEVQWHLWLARVATTLVFVAHAATVAPDVNESHYLTKAKHFWDPNWCSGDLFLNSPSAHIAFFAVFGWMTKFVSLSTFAWTGRILVWLVAAFGWSAWMSRLGIRYWLIPIMAIVWLLLIERGDLSGEWVIGGFEGKSVAFCLILHACANAAVGRNGTTWIFLGVATLFHFLVGTWVSIGFFGAYFYQVIAGRTKNWIDIFQDPQPSTSWLVPLSKNARYVVPFVAIAWILAALPSILADSGTDAYTQLAAAEIQVENRLAHHLYFNAFPTIQVASFLGLVILYFFVAKMCQHDDRVLFWKSFAMTSLLVSFAGVTLSAISESKGLGSAQSVWLLRLYWFRLADFAIPTCITLMLGRLISSRIDFSRSRVLIYASLVLFLLAFGINCVEEWKDRRPTADQASLPTYDDDSRKTQETFRNWKATCEWIRNNMPEDAVFITPAEQQTFKWYAERAEVVCWKDMPQDATSIVEWWDRVNQLVFSIRNFDNGLAAFSDDQLVELGQRFSANYALIGQRDWERRPESSMLKQVFPSDHTSRSTYVVIKLTK